jgi:hypothetical protein
MTRSKWPEVSDEGWIRHDVTGYVPCVRESLLMIEAGVATAYVIAWAVRKGRRIGRRLDVETDEVIDTSLDRLHEVVATKLVRHPVLEELEEEAAAGSGQVSELTRQQMELAITAAAGKDDAFGQAITELIAQLREAEQASGRSVFAGPGSAVFTGNAYAHAAGQGVAFGQVAGDVHLTQRPEDPPVPGRPRH